MSTKAMHIVYTFNDGFCPQVATSICSLCENNKSASAIHFHLLTDKLSTSNQAKLRKMIMSYNRKVTFYPIADLKKYFNVDLSAHGWHPVVLARLLVDKILPKNINRILYLDGDTLILRNLSSFYATNLKNKVLGMSIEPTIDKKRLQKLNISHYFYHNSGVLLIDLALWRQKHAGDKIINYYVKNYHKLFAPDQDAIAIVMKKDIYDLTPNYNFCNIYNQYPYWFFKNRLEPLQYFDKETYLNSIKHPSIIHFLGEDRPWRHGNTHKFTSEYKKYLAKTPWKNTSDETSWETYFVFWRIFNILIKPFPHLRLFIINNLIPVFGKFRQKQVQKQLQKEQK